MSKKKVKLPEEIPWPPKKKQPPTIQQLQDELSVLKGKCKGLEQVKADLQNRCTKLENKLRRRDEEIIRLSQVASVREYKACGKKVTFNSKFKAELRAKEAGHRVYLCPHCKRWHLTSKGVQKDEGSDG